MSDLTGRDVVVCTAETMYRGILIEMSEEVIYLKAEGGWVVIPTEKVQRIDLAE
ncbi:MAG: hypothetical protein ISR96_12580 [Nitrospira sp.]|nr:hypothetical protein [bacterium]MBL7050341.1 hypothetical protein [Nitrospira sp.]